MAVGLSFPLILVPLALTSIKGYSNLVEGRREGRQAGRGKKRSSAIEAEVTCCFPVHHDLSWHSLLPNPET